MALQGHSSLLLPNMRGMRVIEPTWVCLLELEKTLEQLGVELGDVKPKVQPDGWYVCIA